MLEPGWVSENRNRFEVFHVHFGFDAIAAEDLREVVGELKRHHKPLVYTVHDLRNPHHPERTAHDEQQDVLVAAANTLITLTPGAARAVAERWGRKRWSCLIPMCWTVPVSGGLGRGAVRSSWPCTPRAFAPIWTR